jgi:hypothetical protein
MTGYLIKHRSKMTGSESHNTHAYANKYFTQKYVDFLNSKYKNEIHHWIIDAPSYTPYLDIRDYSICDFK